MFKIMAVHPNFTDTPQLSLLQVMKFQTYATFKKKKLKKIKTFSKACQIFPHGN